MLTLACSADTTWSSIDISNAFLNSDIHDEDTMLDTPPPILVKMDIVKPNTVWQVKKAVYGLREATLLFLAKTKELEGQGLNLVICYFYAKALFCALLRPFALLRLRSLKFAVICALSRVSVGRP